MRTVKPPHTQPDPLAPSELHGLMLDCMVEGVFCLDTQGNITFLNRAAAQMFQVDPGALVH